jgi:hypothetical protein
MPNSKAARALRRAALETNCRTCSGSIRRLDNDPKRRAFRVPRRSPFSFRQVLPSSALPSWASFRCRATASDSQVSTMVQKHLPFCGRGAVGDSRNQMDDLLGQRLPRRFECLDHVDCVAPFPKRVRHACGIAGDTLSV